MVLPKTKTFLITTALDVPILFLIDLWNFHIIFFQYTPPKISSLQPSPYLDFFWDTSSCHATKIVIWLFGWSSPVHWAVPEKIQTGGGWWIYFSENLLQFLDLSLYLRKLWRKQAFTPWKLEILQNCVPPLGNSMVKNQNPRKFHISLSLKLQKSMSMDNKGLENQYHKISSLEFEG